MNKKLFSIIATSIRQSRVFTVLWALLTFRFKELRNLPFIRDSLLLVKMWEKRQSTLVVAFLFFFLSFILNILIMMGFEHLSLQESFWFTIVTVSTVGYGDFYPSTFWGRLLVIYFILIGITTFTIVVGELLNLAAIRAEKRRKGMQAYRGSEHVIVVCPEGTSVSFVQGVCWGLRKRMKEQLSLVLISPQWEELPSALSDFNAHFIFGDLESNEVFEHKANLHAASCVIVFPGVHGDAYTANLGHCLRRLNFRVRRVAFAEHKSSFLDSFDEIIIPSDVSSAIAAESIVGFGGRIVDDLLHPETGSRIVSVPADLFHNLTYSEIRALFISLPETVTVLGFTRRGKVFNNPQGELTIDKTDLLNLIVEHNFNWEKSKKLLRKMQQKQVMSQRSA